MCLDLFPEIHVTSKKQKPIFSLFSSSSSYPDEYVLEDLDLSVADYVQRAMKANFPAAWEELGATNELEDTYALSSFKTLEEAVKNIVQFLGMQPCERSDKVPEGKSSHTLVMAGKNYRRLAA